MDDILADDGVQTPQGFESMEALGFGRAGPFTTDPELVRRVAERLGPAGGAGGDGEHLQRQRGAVRRRGPSHRVQVETMEGAAIAAACRQFAVPWVQLRVVSNETGDRDRAGWRQQEACAAVQDLVLRLMAKRWAQ